MEIDINTATYRYRENDGTNTKYTVELVLTDGTKMSVPIDTDNRHYRMVLEWADIDGNNITDPGA
jgi:hypothetical protein|tara:strand:- start:2391 stop:2585 length:195 start_codon:yes stop_codon:yes gene_type:complete